MFFDEIIAVLLLLTLLFGPFLTPVLVFVSLAVIGDSFISLRSHHVIWKVNEKHYFLVNAKHYFLQTSYMTSKDAITNALWKKCLYNVRQTNSALSNLSLNIQGHEEVPKSGFF